jgi:hypothetical protein
MGPTSLQKDPVVLDYNKSSRIKLSNITEVQIAWDSLSKTKYGAAGMFIASGAYQEEPIPILQTYQARIRILSNMRQRKGFT